MTKEDRLKMLDAAFVQYGVQEEYILSQELENDILTLKLKDENDTEATLVFDFNKSKYKITSGDFKKTHKFFATILN